MASHAEARLLPRNPTGFRVVRVGPALRGGTLADPGALDAASGLVSFGFAGGLDPALSAGTVLLPRQIRTRDDRVIGIDRQWHSRVAARLGPDGASCEGGLLTVDHVVSSGAHKHELGRRSGDAAVDLESGPLALVAARAHLPFLVLRVVLDAADDDLPDNTDRLLTASGRARPAMALLALLRSPRRFLLLLQRQRCASARLRHAFQLGQAALREPAACRLAGPAGHNTGRRAQ